MSAYEMTRDASTFVGAAVPAFMPPLLLPPLLLPPEGAARSPSNEEEPQSGSRQAAVVAATRAVAARAIRRLERMEGPSATPAPTRKARKILGRPHSAQTSPRATLSCLVVPCSGHDRDVRRDQARFADLMTIGVFGASFWKGPAAPVSTATILSTTSMPFTTLPKTV